MFWDMAACLRFRLGAGTGVGAVEITTAGGDASRGDPGASMSCEVLGARDSLFRSDTAQSCEVESGETLAWG